MEVIFHACFSTQRFPHIPDQHSHQYAKAIREVTIRQSSIYRPHGRRWVRKSGNKALCILWAMIVQFPLSTLREHSRICSKKVWCM
jgi:hypothetical protein